MTFPININKAVYLGYTSNDFIKKGYMPMDFFNIEISWKGIGYIVITSVSSVIVLFILTRIMGKRQISQLTMFDYINGITTVLLLLKWLQHWMVMFGSHCSL